MISLIPSSPDPEPNPGPRRTGNGARFTRLHDNGRRFPGPDANETEAATWSPDLSLEPSDTLGRLFRVHDGLLAVARLNLALMDAHLEESGLPTDLELCAGLIQQCDEALRVSDEILAICSGLVAERRLALPPKRPFQFKPFRTASPCRAARKQTTRLVKKTNTRRFRANW